MPPKRHTDAESKLRKSRMNLLMKYPFWGELALRLRLVKCNAMPTTAVDARNNLYFNEKWVDEFSVKDGMFEFAHEIGHLMFRHHARRPAGSIPSIWNVACDQVIDTHLIDSGLEQSEVSKKMVPDKIQAACRLEDGRVKTSEQRYRELIDEVKDCPKCREVIEQFEKLAKGQKEQDDAEEEEEGNQQGSGNNQKNDESNEGTESNSGSSHSSDSDDNTGSEGDNSSGGSSTPHVHGQEGSEGCNDSGEGSGEGQGNGSGAQHICGNIRQCCSGSMSEADPETVESMKQAIVAAAKTAKMKGNLPGIAKDFLSELERPSRDWRDVVRTTASKVYRGRYTFKRPSRRSSAIGIRLPARQPKPEPPVGVIDCSGSIGIATITRFMSECAGVMKASGAPEMYLLFHDTRCYDQGYFDKSMLTKIKVTHGGTSHMDVWEKLGELDFKPGIIICFTDLYSDHMQLTKPGCPVIWCHPRGNGDEQPIPFGIKIDVPES